MNRKLIAVLALAVAVTWVGGIQGAFHFDDSHSVESNLALRSLENIPSFWTDSRTSSFIPQNRVYRPLVYTFYSICWAIGKGSTMPFHFMKIIMHFLVCLALFRIWRRLWSVPGWFPVNDLAIRLPLMSREFKFTPELGAFLVALLFAIHPACAECVDYVSATTSLQCAMFYVWAFVAYLSFRDTGRKRYLAGALFLYFLSVASKEEGITLVAMVFLTELMVFRTAATGKLAARAWGSFKVAIPFLAMGLLLGGWIVLMRPASGDESRGWVSNMDYFMTQWRAYLWYMRLWFWPFDLNADEASVEWSKGWWDPMTVQAIIGNLVLLTIGWFSRKRYPAFLYGLVWFYVTISPASSVVVLAEAINEHRMYLSYIGFVGGTFVLLLALAQGAIQSGTDDQRRFRARAIGAVYALACIGLFTGSQERNRVWANAENLWSDTVEKNPTSGRALNNLALVYMGRADYGKALELLAKCEQHWSTYMYCSLNRAISLQALAEAEAGKSNVAEAAKLYDQSEEALKRALSLNPTDVNLNFHVARFQETVRKNDQKAIELYKFAIERTGWRYPSADINMANCLARLGKLDEARAALERAISVEPANQLAIFTAAQLEFNANRPDAAKARYQQLLKVNPAHLQAWYNIGVIEMNASRWNDAIDAFQKTVAIDPKSEQGLYNLVYVSEKAGSGKLAVDTAKQLVSVYPDKATYQERLKEVQRKFASAQ